MMQRILFLIIIFVGSFAFGQTASVELRASVGDDDTGKSLGGATIEVYKGGQLFASESSKSNGKVNPIDLPVCIGCTYTIKIKKEGYVTKTAILDAHSDYPEEVPPGAQIQKFDVSIFQGVEGVDFSFLDREPMVEFKVDAYGVVTYDQKKINVMTDKIKKLRKEMEEKREQLAKEEEAKAKLEADFSAYVAAGDDAVSKSDFERAIEQYKLALGLKPDDQPTKNKLSDAEIKLEELRAAEELEKQFGELMTKAKEAYTNEELEKALDLYKQASSLKKNEALPKERIKEIEEKIATQKANAEKFEALVKEGDQAASSKDFDNAIEKYEAALVIKKEKSVEDKIEAVKKEKEAALAAEEEEKAKQKEFDELIAKADGEFDAKKLDDAVKNYSAALEIFSDNAHAKSRLVEIEKLKAAEKAAAEKAAEEEATFNRLLEEGKEKINQREWSDALAKYKEALKYKPNDKTALDQIDFIKKEQEKEAAEEKLDEPYNAFMAEAKDLFEAEKYEEAKSKYNEALGVKKDEQEPKDQIAKIEQLIADAEKAKELEANYKQFISEGNAAKDRKDYAAAIDSYNKALENKPEDELAKTKIAEVNAIIEKDKAAAEAAAKFAEFVSTAEQAFNAKNYDEAKLNYNKALEIKDDPSVRDEIKKIDDLIAKSQSEAETKAKYEAAIKEADGYYDSNNLEEALEAYKRAFSILEEDHPKKRISELNVKIADQKAAEEKEALFTEYKNNGEVAFNGKKYKEALEHYQNAINTKPDAEITQRIGEIRTLIEEQEANQELRAKYDELIALGNAEFQNKNYKVARATYKEARDVLGSETYPDEKIAEIDEILAKAANAEVEAKYQEIISQADDLFDAKKLDQAKPLYAKALNVKDGDAYAQERIDEIVRLKNEMANAAAEEERLEEEYQVLIVDADRARDAENWKLALEKYNEALSKKPSETYPVLEIEKVKSKMGAAELEAEKEAEYERLIDQADKSFDAQDYIEAIKNYELALAIKENESYPKEKIESAKNFIQLESENEAEAAYQKILDVAQEKFDAKNYDKALELYLRAQKTKPSDPLPQQRIDEINQAKNRQNEDDALEEKYDDLIKEADYQFEKGDWDKAIGPYTEAYNLFNRDYPKNQIEKCKASMQAASDKTAEKNYRKIIKAGDDNFAKAKYEKAKEYYERAIGIKPTDQYPKEQLVEIDKILNPQNYTAGQPLLKDYGKPNTSVSSVDVDAMLREAEEKRKSISANKVEGIQVDALEAERLKDEEQENYSQNTRTDVVELEETIDDFAGEADEERKDAAGKVEEMGTVLNEEDVVRTKMNDNDVQLQTQVVNNLNREMDERDEESDLGREEYLLDVDAIRAEIVLESELEDASQTNATMDQKEYVERETKERIDSDELSDLDRKNTEVRVEDFDVELINEANENTWDQEDVVMQVKDGAEYLVDIQTASDVEENLKRVESAQKVQDETQTRISVEGNRVDNQYDVNISSKKYTENVIDDIDIETAASDIPRQEMEVFSEVQQVEGIEVVDQLQVEQENELHHTDKFVEELEYDIVDESKAAESNREGYELTVDKIKEDQNLYLEGEESDIENESHSTVNYLEDELKERSDNIKSADENADETIDATGDQVDDMRAENNKIDGENKVEQEAVEDYVGDLKEIDVNKITEQMKNQLGEKYPEGVTEEVYTINDEDGLLVSYIVRRVVVRNGAGNVYEKSQSRFGTATYTCNGQGITEFQWQDETESADLVRN